MAHTNTNLTLCIPRVDLDTDKQQVFNVFKSLRIGYIGHINEIPLKHDVSASWLNLNRGLKTTSLNAYWNV
jgi:hypothetical protein